MTYSPIELREMAEHLLDVSRRLGPEAEGIDLLDEDFTIEELVQLRVFLSSTRKAIDLTNSALARYWMENFPGQQWEDKYTTWYVDRSKRRVAAYPDMLLEWFAGLDAEQLGKVVNPNRLAEIIKVTGMTPVERETLLIEEYSPTSGMAIQSKEKR
jgi:hypothetical protein